MKMLVAINEFKGCLTSSELANIVSSAINDVSDNVIVVEESIADGGDGFLSIFTNFDKKKFRTKDAIGNNITANYLVNFKEKTAVIEVAQVIGVKHLAIQQRNPFKATTVGLGELINHLLNRGIVNFIIGLGGSATNECGIGMLSALGYRFYDEFDNICKNGIDDLKKIKYIDDCNVNKNLKNANFSLVCDVKNRLCGSYGATYIFGKQKGLEQSDFYRVDSYMKNFSKLVSEKYHSKKYKVNGCGAAGGLAFGFLAFTRSRIYSGSSFMINYLQLEKKISDCDILVTGEGKLDEQSFMGKAPIELAKLAKKYNKKVIFLAGMIDDTVFANKNYFNLIDGAFSVQRVVVPMKKALEKTLRQKMFIALCFK